MYFHCHVSEMKYLPLRCVIHRKCDFFYFIVMPNYLFELFINQCIFVKLRIYKFCMINFRVGSL